MQGVIFEDQPGTLLVREALLHQSEIQVFVSAVEFVAHDGVAKVCKVDADLMFASGAGHDAEE